jgi:hypothetical protein
MITAALDIGVQGSPELRKAGDAPVDELGRR